MATVYVKKGESVDKAIKRFKAACINEGLLIEIEKRRYALSPTQKRKKKKELAKRYFYRKY